MQNLKKPDNSTGQPLHVVSQASICDTSVSTDVSEFPYAWKERLENCTLDLKCFNLEVAFVTAAHSLWSKASHLANL